MDEREARGGVLVLGGGFAGGYVARLLGTQGATIVSPENFMLYTPLLPEAASGTLEPRHAVVPLRALRDKYGNLQADQFTDKVLALALEFHHEHQTADKRLVKA